MAGGGGIFQRQPQQGLTAIIQQFGRAHVARHQDGTARQLLLAAVAGEMTQQPPRQIVEIMRPFAQDRIAQALHPQPGFVLYALDRGFRRQAGAHRIAHALTPALVIGEQAIGFDDFAPLARQVQFRRHQHLVHGFAQAGNRLFQPLEFFHRIVRDHAVNLHPWFMKDNVPNRYAIGQAIAHEFAGTISAQFRLIQFGDIEEAALRHHFGQHHGHGLQRLDFFFGVDALGLVLHHQHAEHLAAAHNRHAQKAFERVFAGFRAVREMWVGGGVRQIDRFGGFADQADQALALLQAGVVDGGAV